MDLASYPCRLSRGKRNVFSSPLWESLNTHTLVSIHFSVDTYTYMQIYRSHHSKPANIGLNLSSQKTVAYEKTGATHPEGTCVASFRSQPVFLLGKNVFTSFMRFPRLLQKSSMLYVFVVVVLYFGPSLSYIL